MKQIALIISLSGFLVLPSFGQHVSLDSCVQWAYEVQLFKEQQAIINTSREITMANSGKINLPTFEIDGSASYQNENISIPVPTVPGVEAPEVPLNFNRLLINFNQTIYNGGIAARKKRLDSLSSTTQLYELEVQRTRIKAQVTGIYGSVILTRSQKTIMLKQMQTLTAKINQLTGAYESGVAFKSDLLNLQGEKLQVEQKITELEYLEFGLIAQLKQLTAHEIALESTFDLPDINIIDTDIYNRAEFQVMRSQSDVLEAQKRISSASRLPYLGIFASAGVGYPGYDIFNPNVRPMGLIGLKFKWNIVDWGASKNQQQILSLNQSILSYEQSRLAVQLNSELSKQRQEIDQYQKLLQKDQSILDIRKQVTEQVGARLAGGTATSTDYLTQLNNEALAELNSAVHEIKFKLAKINYTIIQGK